ncbi:MAG: hypothetical protein QOJ26_210 [Thermoplasmata archaeon]|nr:hypothetical protein [Thermoplasmata archaeon]
MGIPDFLLRKLYRKGSLRTTADGRFAFTLHNILGTATVVAPPRVVVNGILYTPEKIQSKKVRPADITPRTPFVFRKGDRITVRMAGHLLRGGNRIQVTVKTREFGDLNIETDDAEADFCDVPGSAAEEE